MSEVKKKRGRKPKLKNVEKEEVKPKSRRGRRRKCERWVPANNNVNFIKDLEKLDVKNNELIMNDDSELSEEDYETITFATGLCIRKEKIKKEEVVETSSDDEEECLFDVSAPAKTDKVVKKKTKKKKNKDIFTINSLIIQEDSKKEESPEKVVEVCEPVKKRKSIKQLPTKKKRARVFMKNGEINEEIPSKNDFACWWCTHDFDNECCFIPTKKDPIRKRFRITGNFCSWSCAKAYFVHDRMGYRADHGIIMFTEMLHCMKLPIHVKIAPRRECLKKFGGVLSIEEFRGNAFNDDKHTLKASCIEYDDSIQILSTFT